MKNVEIVDASRHDGGGKYCIVTVSVSGDGPTIFANEPHPAFVIYYDFIYEMDPGETLPEACQRAPRIKALVNLEHQAETKVKGFFVSADEVPDVVKDFLVNHGFAI